MFEELLGNVKRAVPPVVIVDKWDMSWVTLPFTIYGQAQTVIGNKLYLFGGVINGTIVGRTIEIDLETKVITEKVAAAAKRFASGVTFNNRMYVYGGFLANSSSYDGSVSNYDPNTNTWLTSGPAGTLADRYGWSTDGTLIYASGGVNSSAEISNIRAYNPTSQTWNNNFIATAPAGNGTRSVWTNGSLYDTGGFSVPIASTFTRVQTTPAAGGLQTLAPLPSTRFQHVMGEGKGGIYVLGGTAGTPADADKMLRYDINNGKWVEMTPPGVTIGNMAGLSKYNDAFYIVGGQGAGGGVNIHRYHI